MTGPVSKRLHQEVFSALHRLLQQDRSQDAPVAQSFSLFFWEHLQEWVHHISVLREPFTIALTGASGSGKSFIREVIVDTLAEVSEVSSFTQDNYYRDFEADFPHLSLERFYHEINLDDPEHIRFHKLAEDLRRFKRKPHGTVLSIPRLRFGTPTTKPTIIENGLDLKVTPFMVTEGIHAFHEPTVRSLYNFKIYVDVDEQTRRARWLERNRRENRGTTDNMWNTTVDCLHQYILPTRSAADLVINNTAPQEQVVAFVKEVISLLATANHQARYEKKESVA